MSFQGYNNVSGGRPPAAGGKKKKVAIIGVSSIVLVAMVVAVAVGVSHRQGSSAGTGSSSGSGDISTTTKAVKAICQPTDYKETCEKTLSSAAGNTSDPKELIKAGFQVAMNEIREAAKNSTTLQELAKDPRTSQALENCRELMDYSIDDLQNSFNQLGEFNLSNLDDYVEDLKVWLGGAITYQQTCLDGFENTTGDAGEKMKKVLKTAGELSSNGLAMVSEISSLLSSLQIPGFSRRLLSDESDDSAADDSAWWESRRNLMEATPATVKPDVVVAKDGSGKFKTVGEALTLIPKKSNKTFVIYIKEGVYNEQVIVTKDMTHVMMIGDGPTKTKITGNKNYIDGVQTFKTATVAVIGSNFMAKDMGFENMAGAVKHQAVALRVQSDFSVFYNCRMDGYQDTLYTQTHRQFYRDCVITGTIDFIFGDGSVVFQNCRMLVRKPLENQQCIVTAQGRIDRRESTALVLQNCIIAADVGFDPAKDKVNVFLGRPWKEYSRTIIMQSQIDGLIHPDGWLPWMGDFGLKTCFYTEFGNRGAGASVNKRVKWRGIKTITPQHAVDFTAGRFIGGDKWIRPTGVPYTSGMMTV
ncbi:probable pectinesterase/pectinesterase inhibitor 21 [Malania oleifera]|uniref:probable pectinesterase/pectinesterase inhibitor 21 n=1 Tax=Malania oleifera TaxID=397392 RepID=UPI0025AEA9E5|nr:probable pectinesterase/pectinesterase inhibitor 21 [Malania oleifera]